jgi:large subunit ribosomal protein L22
MEVQALTKYVRVSPKKLREVTRVIQGRPAAEALDLLQLIPRKTARLVRKTLVSAIANAENNHRLASTQLVVKYALAEQGSVLKRFRPVSRGSAHSIHKHTSHIRIILSDNAATTTAAAE